MAYSDFNYCTPADLPNVIHSMSAVTAESIAARFISDAEHIVDAYVGPAPRFYADSTGIVTATLTSGAVALASDSWNAGRPNFWARGGVYIELVDGVSTALLGQKRLVVASTEGSVTLASGFAAAVPAGAQFYFSQYSHFPRRWDVNPQGTPYLPSPLMRAVALQVEYGIVFGSEAFGLGDPVVADGELGEVQSRSYASGYAESRAVGGASSKKGLALLIAPRARAELRDLLNSTGYLRG